MTKSKKGFNFLDVLIVLAALCLVAGILWRNELTRLVERQDKENTVEVVCVCTVAEINEGVSAALPEKGAKLYCNGEEVGVLLGKTETATQDKVPEESGEEASEEAAAVPVAEDNTITVRLNAVEKSSGYYIDDVKLIHGATLELYTDLYELKVCICDFE